MIVKSYSVVYADPCWGYDNAGRGSTEAHYPTMSIEEIQALPVADIAASDAVLFIWVTWPFLEEGLATIRAWGFEYKTCAFVWVKYHEKSGKKCVGGGFWTRANTEFCLIGVRGKNHPRRVDKSVRQLIEEWDEEPEVLNAPRGRHSAKPVEARDRIVQLMGDVPRIELFARDRVPGWDAFGNDPAIGGSDVHFVIDASNAVQVNSSPTAATENQGDESMATLPKEMADGVGKARAAGGGNYITQHGDYILGIKKWYYQKVQDRCVITDYVVVSATPKEVYADDQKIVDEPHSPGSDVNYTINYDGKGAQSADSNLRAELNGLFGYQDGEVPDGTISATIAEVCDDVKKPAEAMLIKCSTYAKRIKNPSDPRKPFMLMPNWSCVARPGTGLNDANNTAARKAALAKSNEDFVRLACQQLGLPEPVFKKPEPQPHANGANGAATGGMFAAPPPAAAAAPAAAPAAAAPSAFGGAPAAAPSIPAPPPPAAAPPPPVDPLASWTIHPQDPRYYYRGTEVKLKDDIIAGR